MMDVSKDRGRNRNILGQDFGVYYINP